MKPSPYRPRVQLFVCANRRAAGDPLGDGCGDRGDAVFAALKARAHRGLWVTRTHCLGLCPKTGCTVTVAPQMQSFVEVTVDDVDEILQATAIAAR
jgi:(2Fe-2S) ferredoxin